MRLREEWRQTVPPRAFYRIVFGVAVALCVFGVYTMQYGYQSLDSPVFYRAFPVVYGAILILTLARHGVRALRSPALLILPGSGLMMASHLLARTHPWRGWMEGLGLLLDAVWLVWLLGTFKPPRAPAPGA